MVLHEPVQHGIGHSLVANPLMPVLDGQLTGDDGGALVGTVINDLQQVSSGLTVHGGHAPIVKQKDVGVFERIEPTRERAVGVANAQLLTQAGNPQVQRTVTTPAGMLGQGARQPRLARTRGAGDQHGVTGIDPFAQGQAHHRAALKTACAAAVQVFDGGLRVFELGGFEQTRTAPVLSAMDLPVHQQGQALFKAHGADAVLPKLLLQRLGHALKTQTAQLIQGGVHHHVGFVRVGFHGSHW